MVWLANVSITVALVFGQSLARAGANIGIDGASCAFGSIQAAIAAASENSTIYLEPGVYSQLVGTIDKSLTFVPAVGGTDCANQAIFANRADTVIDGEGLSSALVGGLMHVTSGAQVTFRTLTLRDANATNGGVIAVTDGAMLILDGARVAEGQATESGGNIFVQGSGNVQSEVMLVNDAAVDSGVSGLDGGGIALAGSRLTVINARIGSGSSQNGNTAGNHGGGIYAIQSELALSTPEAEVLNNEAIDSGGGIYALDTVVTMDRAIVNLNQAQRRGGGLYQAGGSVSLVSTTLSENRVTGGVDVPGGGVYLTQTQATLDGCVVDSNEAIFGGGIYGDAGSELIVTNGTIISNNTAFISGGGINSRAALIVEDSQISNNIGGGVRLSSCDSAEISRSQFTQNTGFAGGGITAFDCDLVLNEVTFTENTATSNVGDGGGILLTAGVSTISNCTFEENSATNNGGGLHFQASSDGMVTIENSTFRDNMTLSQSGPNVQGGAGVSLLGGGVAHISNTAFSGNSAGRFGGALYVSQTALTATNVKLINNGSLTTGGGIYLRDADVTIRSDYSSCNPQELALDEYCTTIASNQSRSSGGGIFIADGENQVSLQQVALLENISNSDSGDAIYAVGLQPTQVTLENSLVARNGRPGSTGGTLEFEGLSELRLESSTVVDNRASPIKIGSSDTELVVSNSIVYLNDMGPDVASSFNRPVSCSNIQPSNGLQLGENLGNPAFEVGNPAGSYQLSEFSPSVNRCNEGPAQDLAGRFRPDVSGLFDQGAYEREGLSVRPDALFADGFE